MNFIREANKAIRTTLILWVITAIIYPLVMIAFGQLIFPFQANGSILTNSQGQPIGSALIGQPFSSDRYFNSRPSTTNYSTANPQTDEAKILQTGVSGASNIAPSNPELFKRVQTTIEQLKKNGIQPTADFVYTSGSGLDPHITLEAAKAQTARIVQARNVKANELERLINSNIDHRFLGIFGEPGVNVLKLNLALDALKPTH